ncbi:HAD-IB family hydrolase [Candidatus Woesebacteria bacterium]|nr:HAD-IB family hydrolase [Candidatus Woesebacteria bacterium]
MFRREVFVMNLAFFDVDKTLYDGYSNKPFLDYLTKVVKPNDPLVQDIWQKETQFLNGELEYNQATQYFLGATGRLVAGLQPETVLAWVKRLFPEPQPFFPWVGAVLEYLRAQNYRIYLVSGAPAVVIEELARQLGVEHYFATEFLLDTNGVYSGEIHLMNHETKRSKLVETVKKISGNHQVISFGDSPGDVPLLEAADIGFVVQPDHNPEMVELSQKNNWVVLKHETALEQIKQTLFEKFDI